MVDFREDKIIRKTSKPFHGAPQNVKSKPPRDIQKPLMVVVAAPSGAGKTTLCNMLLHEFPSFVYSVSCTTRAPRGTEVDGVAYSFLKEGEFLGCIEAGDFLEHAVVHGNRYGTLKATVQAAMEAGHSVILDIDVDGAAQVRRIVAALPDDDPMKVGFLDIFLTVVSLDVLRARLVKRGEDAPETIEQRLRNASEEMARAGEFSHVVVSDVLEETYAAFKAIILKASEACQANETPLKGMKK